MKRGFYYFLFSMLLLGPAYGQSFNLETDEPVRFAAEPASGFSYPYYLYVPHSILRSKGNNRKHF